MSLEMFIMKCLKYDNSPDMCKIIDSKVKKHYHACNAAYTSSETFKKLLQTRMELIDKDPKNLYVYIKEIVDELKVRHKKGPPQKKIKLDTDSSESSNLEKPTEDIKTVKEESQFQERAVRKLSKMLHCLQRKIMKLEQKEVDWDEENDSTYIQLQRYKERAVAVYKKLQQYECGVIPKLQEKRTITYSGTAFPSVNRAIEKYVNKTGQFPDYQEVLRLLKSAYEQQKMNITPERLRNQAKAAFQTIGEQLQRQRQFSTWNAHAYYLGQSKDPAEDDQELDKKLKMNKEEFGNRISEIINKFAEETKDVVPEEVPDNESASKSEDEEDDVSEEKTDDESEREDNFVDDLLAGMDNKENDTSEIEEDSNEDSDANVDGGEKETKGKLDSCKQTENENVTSENEEVSIEDSDANVTGEDTQAKEIKCKLNSSKQTENEEDNVGNHEKTTVLIAEAERTENNGSCNMLEESPATSTSIKVEAVCTLDKNHTTVSVIPLFKLQDRHNGVIQKCEQVKNDPSQVDSCKLKQAERHTTYSVIDNDSDNDVIILE